MKSMTGYAFVARKDSSHSVEVIMRSHNFKYLELAIRNLPQDRIVLEEKIKKEIQKKIQRGKIEIFVFLKGPVEGSVYINEKTIAKYITQIKRVSKNCNLRYELQLKDILHLPHVVSWQENRAEEENIILPAVRDGIKKLLEFKEKEGKIIKNQILGNLKKLKANITKIREQKPEATGNTEKQDIDEEVSLMAFYTDKLENTVTASSKEPKGKAIDFLIQEILRELNAASSKTNNAKLGSIIVESKNYIERIREQAQNIE